MPDQPPLLAYDHAPVVPPKRVSNVLPGYAAGVMLMGAVYDLISYPICLWHFKEAFSQVLYGLIIPPALALVSLLPQMIFLGISGWIKSKVAKDSRFRSFRAALAWGMIGGLAPWGLLPLFREFDVQIPRWLMMAEFGWFVTIPTLAGLSLCRYSPLRD